MSEIKFRAWIKPLNRYMYLSERFMCGEYDCFCLGENVPDEETVEEYRERSKNYLYEDDIDNYIFEQQAFGLTDKNNIEIYQGDIANSCYGIGEVILTEQGFKFEFDLDITELWGVTVGREGEKFEIISHIHKNKE